MLPTFFKKTILRIPVLSQIAHSYHRRRKAFSFEAATLPSTPPTRGVVQAQNLLSYTKATGRAYSATKYPAGYHTIEVAGVRLEGQRDPKLRLAQVPVDFTNKSVLDIGCNQGGMLHAMDGSLRWGVGIDFEPKLVNAANAITRIRDDPTLHFYTFDLEHEPLNLILSLLPEERPDIIFMLSIAMWIPNWREVIAFAAATAPVLIFESNGTPPQQEAQESFLRSRYSAVELLAGLSDDDPKQKRRRLLMCSH